jgi:hypothetical protein
MVGYIQMENTHGPVMLPRLRNIIQSVQVMECWLVWYGRFKRTSLAGEVLMWGIACGTAAASLDGTAVGTLAQVKAIASEVTVKICASKKHFR